MHFPETRFFRSGLSIETLFGTALYSSTKIELSNKLEGTQETKLCFVIPALYTEVCLHNSKS